MSNVFAPVSPRVKDAADTNHVFADLIDNHQTLISMHANWRIELREFASNAWHERQSVKRVYKTVEKPFCLMESKVSHALILQIENVGPCAFADLKPHLWWPP